MDLSRDLCCCVALSGGACVFSCKRARRHDQRVDMKKRKKKRTDYRRVPCDLEVSRLQHGQEHQEFLIFLAHNVTLAPRYHMLKAKLKNYTSYNELYSKYQCIINIQVYLLLPALKINLCTLNIFRNMRSSKHHRVERPPPPPTPSATTPPPKKKREKKEGGGGGGGGEREKKKKKPDKRRKADSHIPQIYI